MQKIPLKLSNPGMELAKPVTRENGMVLIAEDTELTESIISRLHKMEVTHLVVKGNPVDFDKLGDSAGSSSATNRLQRLEHLFRDHRDDEWMQKVKKFMTYYFKSRAALAGADKVKNSEQEE